MAARDRYKYDVTCPQCGETAVFHVSEDDYPFMRGPKRALDLVEGNMTGWVIKEVDCWARCGAYKREFKT